jgi:hypothetical protein
MEVLIGTQRYVDWASHEVVRKLALIYFDSGEPIAPNLQAVSRELADLRTMRNAAAHVTSTTQRTLDALATRIMRANRISVSVEGFLLEIHPDHAGVTILQYYQQILDVVAENIAKNQS